MFFNFGLKFCWNSNPNLVFWYALIYKRICTNHRIFPDSDTWHYSTMSSNLTVFLKYNLSFFIINGRMRINCTVRTYLYFIIDGDTVIGIYVSEFTNIKIFTKL